MSIREKYVKVREAATILGVAPNTVRAWGAAGKLPEVRSPANGYRLYRRSDLEKFLHQLDQMAARAANRK
jgi:excisionase family DNA binding protein